MSRNIHQTRSPELDIANLERRLALIERSRSFAPPIRTKAGVPVDGDFTTTPANGTMVIDTTNHRLYVRSGGGIWKYTALT